MSFNQWGTFNQWQGEPIIINAALGSTYSVGCRANVTIGTVTIRIYSGTHYEIPNY